LSQAGEFGIVVVGSALQFNIISTEVNKLVATSILLTMIIAPFIARMTNLLGSSVNVDPANVAPIGHSTSDEKKAA